MLNIGCMDKLLNRNCVKDNGGRNEDDEYRHNPRGGGQLIHKEVWIWGVGETADRYQNSIFKLIKEGVKIGGYCDNNSEWWGCKYNTLPVISPEELKKKNDIIVMICSLQKKVLQEVGSQLTNMQKEWYVYDEVIYTLHKKEMERCYELLTDEFSKKVYQTMVLARIQGGDKTARPFNADNVFSRNYCFDIAAFERIDRDEVYVDCGAYVGDSIERYLFKKFGVVKKIIGFEPDENNFLALSERRKRLLNEWGMKEDRIQIYQMAVGERTGIVKFASTELDGRSGGKIGNEGKNVQMISLDNFITEPYSQIKIDTIGSEMAILNGAKNGVRKWKPNIVVSMTYQPEDLYEIPLFLHELVPEYKFAVRHHRNAMEMMLYAWIE